MKYALLTILLLAGIASASLVEYVVQKAKAPRPTAVGKRSIFDCQDSASTISSPFTIGTVQSGSVISGGCAGFYFTQASLSQNLELSVDSSEDITLSFGWVSGSLSGKWNSISIKYAAGVQKVVVPGCSFVGTGNTDGRWYIVVSSLEGTTFSFNTTLASPATPFFLGEGALPTTSLNYQPKYYNILVQDQSVSRWVDINSISRNPALSRIEIFVDEFGVCPTKLIGPASTNRFTEPFRTRLLGVTPQIGISSNVFSQVSFNLSTRAVECQEPSSLGFCEVDYPIADFSNADYNDFQVQLAVADTAVSADCAPVFKQMLCATTFPACDDNGFDRILCPEDCELIKKHCLTEAEAVRFECSIESENSKCYITPPSTASTQFLSFGALMIGMLANLL